MTALGGDLLRATAELVDVASVSHREAALADLVERRLRDCGHLIVERIGDNVVARTGQGRPRRVVLAGHLDTVPPNGNASARIEGDVLWGLGSADMKGGLAVMLDLAESLPAPAVDVTYAFYVAEEVAREHNGLLQIEAAAAHLLEGDAAVLGEPTGAVIEAGILDGDFVVVRQQEDAEKGDVVVAGIPGDEATVKTYGRKGAKIVLNPANPTMDPMVFDPSDVHIYGKVVTVLRRL